VTPRILDALRILDVAPRDTARATGWALALAWTSRATTELAGEQRAAVRRLALALDAGDTLAADRAARWITDPAGAMEAALRDLRDGHALDGEVRL